LHRLHLYTPTLHWSGTSAGKSAANRPLPVQFYFKKQDTQYAKIASVFTKKGGFVAWLLLFSAGVIEVVFAISLKYNEGFTRLWPSVLTAFSGAGSFYLLTMAIKTLPIGTAYAVWTGMGAVGVAILGVILFKESADWPRLLSIVLIVVGIVGLKLTDAP
jgi:quaternary ammonium compound-resistance protein SugE